ncbi:hypothetical protein LOAG_04454 [Loa loa]|uniref:Uncharacterized protein n=1 Tax=Loa loa TaxID=7209 RepID=A0A1S0U1U8_LOALO|nr:hypothetical protein LOAG_04454 [Loa loa]EFO24029.1 hypothetical protein LOAG_04454 [Loa loa]
MSTYDIVIKNISRNQALLFSLVAEHCYIIINKILEKTPRRSSTSTVAKSSSGRRSHKSLHLCSSQNIPPKMTYYDTYIHTHTHRHRQTHTYTDEPTKNNAARRKHTTAMVNSDGWKWRGGEGRSYSRMRDTNKP